VSRGDRILAWILGVCIFLLFVISIYAVMNAYFGE
jgi:hypothetical protein